MKIAITGTHCVGKTTLVEALAEKLGYATIEEPYRVLEEEGVDLGVSVEDFEVQLEKSVELVDDAPRDAVIDRCALDFVAYLRALDREYEIDTDAIEAAMESIDMVVVVRIEEPDRIAVPADEDRALRRAVDTQIERLVVNDGLGLGLEIVEVEGTIDERVAQVLAALR